MNDLAMDAPYRPAALDRAQQGLLGKPIDRYEGASKVSGAAAYAYEQAPENTAYMALVTAGIGRVDAAEEVAGAVGHVEAVDLLHLLQAATTLLGEVGELVTHAFSLAG